MLLVVFDGHGQSPHCSNLTSTPHWFSVQGTKSKGHLTIEGQTVGCEKKNTNTICDHHYLDVTHPFSFSQSEEDLLLLFCVAWNYTWNNNNGMDMNIVMDTFVGFIWFISWMAIIENRIHCLQKQTNYLKSKAYLVQNCIVMHISFSSVPNGNSAFNTLGTLVLKAH